MTSTPLYDSHMHTVLCKHARGEPEDYAEHARARGLDGIIMTCHNPMPDDVSHEVRMLGTQFPAYLALVERARRACEGRVDLRLGLECDYIPEFEPWLARQAESADFDFLLGSVHPHLGYYRERYATDDPMAFYRTYFDNVAAAAESGVFDSVAHFDCVKNYYPDDWQLEPLFGHIKHTLDRIAATGMAMEVNTSGLASARGEAYPGPEILREMARRKIPVTLGSDAHDPHRVGVKWEEAVDKLEQVGYSEIQVFLQRKPHAVPLAQVRRKLRPMA